VRRLQLERRVKTGDEQSCEHVCKCACIQYNSPPHLPSFLYALPPSLPPPLPPSLPPHSLCRSSYGRGTEVRSVHHEHHARHLGEKEGGREGERGEGRRNGQKKNR